MRALLHKYYYSLVRCNKFDVGVVDALIMDQKGKMTATVYSFAVHFEIIDG